MNDIEGLVPKLPNAAALDFTKYASNAARGWIAYDKYVPEFTKRVKLQHKQFGINPAVALGTSSTSVHEALFRAITLKDPEYTTVVFQANCYPSVVFAAQRAGLTPLFCNVDETTGEICPTSLAAVSDSCPPKVIIHVTDIGGSIPQDYATLPKIVGNKALIIEDAAHAWGSYRGASKETAWADFVVYSFSPTKPMTTGGGGAVISGSYTDIVEHCEALLRYGRKNRFGNGVFIDTGYGGLFSEINAAMGNAVLNHYKPMWSVRNDLATQYTKLLADVPEISLINQGTSSWYKYLIYVPKKSALLVDHLKENGIKCSSKVYDKPAYMACDEAGMILKQGDVEELCVSLSSAFDWSLNHVCLPMHSYLNPEDPARVVNSIKDFFGKNK